VNNSLHVKKSMRSMHVGFVISRWFVKVRISANAKA